MAAAEPSDNLSSSPPCAVAKWWGSGMADQRELAAAGLYLERRSGVEDIATTASDTVVSLLRCSSCSFHVELEADVELRAENAIRWHALVSPECPSAVKRTAATAMLAGDNREVTTFQDLHTPPDGYSSDSDGSFDIEFQQEFQEYESMQVRLGTFQGFRTDQDGIEPDVLAAAGFYRKPRFHDIDAHSASDGSLFDAASTGEIENDSDDILQCWSCSLPVATDEMTGSSKCPFLVHRQRAPQCPFLRTLEQGRAFEIVTHNGEVVRDVHENNRTGMFSEHYRLSSFTAAVRVSGLAAMATVALAEHGFYHTGFGCIVRCAFCKLTMDGEQVEEAALHRQHRFRSPFCKLVRGQCPENEIGQKAEDDVERDEVAEDDMATEKVRFATFRDWPEDVPVCVGKLAATGFYYAGEGTKLTCFSCQAVIQHYSTGRSVSEAHMVQMPSCPQLTGSDMSNVPLEVPAIGALERLQDLPARTATFHSWHTRVPISGEELADAGFFSLDVGDVVLCAYCQLEVRHWRPGQTAWGRHRQQSPGCEHVRRNCPANPAVYAEEFYRRVNRHVKRTARQVSDIARKGGLPQRSYSPVMPFIQPVAQVPPTPPTPQISPLGRIDSQPPPQQQQHAQGENNCNSDMPWSSTHSFKPPLSSGTDKATPQMQMSPSPASTAAVGPPEYKSTSHTAPQTQGDYQQYTGFPRQQQRRAPAPRPKPVQACVSCNAPKVSHFLMPCSHLSCALCAQSLAFCPTCGEQVRSLVRLLKL
ncbi:uncharacterized protein LOC135814159 [Sycon ciliatum]|uniref:uncharacterized protein LOC135814159 n=1 Tax=Sycon ciliatum TaxID=27933 RepID=UPI0031F6861F